MLPGHWWVKRSRRGRFSSPPTVRQRNARHSLCAVKTNVKWTCTLDERTKGTLLWNVGAALVNFLHEKQRYALAERQTSDICDPPDPICLGAVGLHWSEQRWTAAGPDRHWFKTWSSDWPEALWSLFKDFLNELEAGMWNTWHNVPTKDHYIIRCVYIFDILTFLCMKYFPKQVFSDL